MLNVPRQLWAILTTRERWQLVGLSVVILFMGVAQMVSVGSIAPFVSVLVDPESVQTNQLLRWAFDGLGFESTNSFLVFLALVVLAAVIIANGFLALTQWLLIRFGWALQYRLSRGLLETYLAQPYSAFSGRNSADTGKNVLTEVEHFVQGVVFPLLRVASFGVSGLILLAALFWVNTWFTIVAIAVLAGGYGAVYIPVRHILGRAGRQRFQANTERFKVVNEAFGGIKEIKVLGRETGSMVQFDGPAKRYSRSQETAQVFSQIPGNALQVLAVAVILLLALFLIVTADGTIQDVAPLLAVYIFAAQRMVPFLLRVYENASTLRINSVVLDAIYEDMSGKPQTDLRSSTGTRLPFQSELRLQGVTFSYSRDGKPAVNEITVTISHGSFVAFVGATGAGKTTLVDIILGLLQPSEGVITVDGVVLDETTIRDWQNNLGYVPQDIYLADDTIAANIAFGIPPQDRQQTAIVAAATIANLHEFIEQELPDSYDTVVGERGVRLSGGQRQRIGIARALYHDPEVLVLDEATSNLDQGTERAVHKAIEQAAAAKTIIMIAHRLSTTRNCDTLYMLDRGSIVAQGSYDTLINGSDQFREMAASV